MDIEPNGAVSAEVSTTDGAQENPGFMHTVSAQTPWWAVSVTLHVLIIVLTTLISYTVDLGELKPVTTITMAIEPPITQVVNNPIPVVLPEDILAPKKFTATETDPKGPPPERDLIVDPDLIREANLDNHFVTNNPDMEDRDQAHGHPDSKTFFDRAFTANDVPGGSAASGNLSGAAMADLIGVDGDSTLGNGGFGKFLGDGDGMGSEKGSGKAPWGGRFGGRRFKIGRQTGMTKTELDAVDKALSWLAYHQQQDGSWDSKKYGASTKSDTACTGFALLAFLGAGHTERVGIHKGTVAKAVAWLKTKQAADGSIWDTTDDGAHHRKIGYPNAIATLAMAEAAGMANIPDTRASAQKAIDYCTKIHQQGEGSDKRGWRYAAGTEGDLSVTGWYIMALKSAKVAGLKVDNSAFDGATAFLDQMEIKDTQSSSYPISRYKYMVANEHAHSGHRLTAIGTLARLFMGVPPEQVQGSVEWFVNKGGVPEHGANGEKVDLYYWYYGSLCVFQQGPKSEIWKKWSSAMRQEFVGTQCKAGDDAGSWNPAGDYSSEWGRVGQTALSALCLEVYYRYDLLNK